MTDRDLQRLGEENYRPHGVYRSIKYASRFPLPLTRTRVDGIGRGLTCSMTVILAFQIAELRHKKLVTSISTQTDLSDTWISDKHSQKKDTFPFPAGYQAYLSDIRVTSARTEPRTRPGYTCWTGKDCTPEKFCHETFPIDTKSIGVACPYLHLVEKNTTRHDLGKLDVCTRNFTLADKKQERMKRRQSFIESLANLVDITDRYRSRPRSMVQNYPN